MRGCHYCRVCGEGVARGEGEQHATLHHPRIKFARGGTQTREGEVDVKVKGIEEACKIKAEKPMIKLEEVVEVGEVTRKPGETRVKLTKGEADIVLGREARTVNGLMRRTGVNISIKRDFEEDERIMVITGKEEHVLMMEGKVSKVLAVNTYIEIKLKKAEFLSLMGVGFEKGVKIKNKTGACIYAASKVQGAKEVSMIISGTPEAVASAKISIRDILNTGKEIEVTKRQASYLVGGGGRTMREIQDITGAQIANFGKASNTEMQKFMIYGSKKAKEKALKRIHTMLENLGV